MTSTTDTKSTFSNALQLNLANCCALDLGKISNMDLLEHPFYEITIEHGYLLINIRANLELDQPIYIFGILPPLAGPHIDAGADDKSMPLAGIHINLGANSKVTLIEHKYNVNDPNYITKILCQANSQVDYYAIQQHDCSRLQVEQYDHSLFVAKILAVPSTSNQLSITINLLATKATAHMNILQQAKEGVRNAIDLRVNHLAPECCSYSTVRALANHHANIKLHGQIFVDLCARQTNADLQIKNLMLAKQATIISLPELVIYNKEVQCKHGASTGNLNVDVLFYLQSRGLSLEAAIKMLVDAFVAPIIQQIKYQEILAYLSL